MNRAAVTLGMVSRHTSRMAIAALGAAAALAAFAAPALSSGSGPAHEVGGLPLPSPTLPLPSPSLPVSTPTLPLPSPSVPSILPSPTPSLPPVGLTSPSPSSVPGGAGGGTGKGSNGGGSGGGGTQPPRGISIPFTNIVLTSPLDVALAVSLAALPLLLAIWALVFGRTWVEARRARDAGIRLALAADLGLSPRELTSLTTKGLFKLREQAAFDDLTGVLRRAAGIAGLEREIARARRQKSPLTVAFVDIDGLKQANDTRGHSAGDELLKGLASSLKAGLRGQDLVVRYGGDEFVSILPDTPLDSGGDKMRQIQADAGKAGISFSLGLAELARSDDVVSLLGRADRELYDAKASRQGIHNLRPESRSDPGGRRRVPA